MKKIFTIFVVNDENCSRVWENVGVDFKIFLLVILVVKC